MTDSSDTVVISLQFLFRVCFFIYVVVVVVLICRR